MINFYELEKKCKRNKLKTIFKFSAIFIGIILVLYISLLLFSKYSHKNDKTKILQRHLDKQKVKIEKKKTHNVEIKKVTPSKKVLKKEVKIIPQITYMLDLNNISVKNNNNNKKHNKVINKKITNNKQEKVKSKNINKNVLKTTSLTLQTVLIKIKNSYENGNFDDAINWCKIGSKIDNKNEDIWSYYALSLYKQGEKGKAIKVLKTYLKYRKSQKIEKILKRLK